MPPHSLDDDIAIALNHHRSGRLADAAAAYRRILDTHPDHPGVLHNLGVILAQTGEPAAALDLFDRALAAKPDYPAAHMNRAGALRALARFDEAIIAYDRAIALAPSHPEPHVGKGDALRRLGRFDEAARCYRRALGIDPAHYQAHLNLGLALNAAGQRREALDQFRTTLAMRRGPHPIDPEHYSFRSVSRQKLRHDIEQFRYLAAAGSDPDRFRMLGDAYEAVDRNMDWPTDDTALVKLPDELRARIGDSFNRPIHRVEAPELPGSSLNPNLDVAAITRRYVETAPGVATFDDLLTAEALRALRRFLLESTIWFDFAHIGGFVAAYLEDGMACPLLLQIGEDLRRTFPAIFQGQPLNQAWAFKCLHGERGIDVHADAAAVSVNFWVTPDDANQDPAHGGLVIYTRLPPPGWTIKDYGADIAAIRAYLGRDEGKDAQVVVPYRQNRVVFFNSVLFHESDRVDFKSGYQNHRINITMLFGSRPD